MQKEPAAAVAVCVKRDGVALPVRTLAQFATLVLQGIGAPLVRTSVLAAPPLHAATMVFAVLGRPVLASVSAILVTVHWTAVRFAPEVSRPHVRVMAAACRSLLAAFVILIMAPAAAQLLVLAILA